MVNLVKMIESLLEFKHDEQIMKSLKKQLKIHKSDINKQRQSIVLNWTMSPIHAAILSRNPQILQLVLDVKGVDVDSIAVVKSENQLKKYGVLDLAISLLKEPDTEMVRLLLKNIRKPNFDEVYLIAPGFQKNIPNCLFSAIDKENFEILDLLHSKAGLVESFNPIYSLLIAIVFNRPRIFNHVLPQAKKDINRPFPMNDSKVTQVTPMHSAILAGSLKILQKILDTEGVDLHSKVHIKTEVNEVKKFGALDVAICLSKEPNIEIVKLIVEKIEKPALCEVEDIFIGKLVSMSHLQVIELENLKLLDLLHSKTDLGKTVDPFHSFLLSIMLNKTKVFSYLIPQAKLFKNQRVFWEEKNMSLLEFAKAFERSEMAEQLLEVYDDKKDNLEKESKAGKSRICRNCSKTGKYLCTGCRRVRYCDDKCQEEDWDKHKGYCLVKMNRRAFKEFSSLTTSIFE